MDRTAALALLKDVLAETVRADGPDLNVRQALDALSGLGLAARLPDESDRRSVLVQTTARGLAVLAGLGDRVIACERANAAAVQKAGQKTPELKPTASSQPPVHKPAAQPAAPRDGAGSSSHAA